jgi:phage shock protein PspC (stress-responsive transcriptional regulator)
MKKLYRSRNNRRIFGVCGGLAEYFSVDPVLIRIIAALSILSGLGIMVYIIMAIIVPLESTEHKNVV